MPDLSGLTEDQKDALKEAKYALERFANATRAVTAAQDEEHKARMYFHELTYRIAGAK